MDGHTLQYPLYEDGNTFKYDFAAMKEMVQRENPKVLLISNGFIVPPREFRNEHRLVPILLGQEIVDCLFQYIFSTITQQYLRFIDSVSLGQNALLAFVVDTGIETEFVYIKILVVVL